MFLATFSLKSESTFLVQYIIIFQTKQSLESPGFTPGGDRDTRPPKFLQEI